MAGKGRPVEWDDPEPWPESINGAELLGELKAKVEHYAFVPAGGAEAVALWALYTWVFPAFAISPYLMVTAPEREAGKTRVTELLSWMVRRAKPVSDASAAAIIRGIESDGPTLIFDEAQHFLKRRPEDPIRGILLAGFTKRFATVERCEGDANQVRAFSTFAPKAMNGRNLAGMDDMLTSRSIVIPMTRANRPLPELRADRDPVGEDLRRQCARWAADNEAGLREADPDTGGRIGRIAQVWRPLFAIADAAGGNWPTQAPQSRGCALGDGGHLRRWGNARDDVARRRARGLYGEGEGRIASRPRTLMQPCAPFRNDRGGRCRRRTGRSRHKHAGGCWLSTA